MGKVYEWARLDGRRDDDAVNERVTFRRGRLDVFTAWNWVNWWLERGSFDYVECSAGVGVTTLHKCGERLALHAAQRFVGSCVCAYA